VVLHTISLPPRFTELEDGKLIGLLAGIVHFMITKLKTSSERKYMAGFSHRVGKSYAYLCYNKLAMRLRSMFSPRTIYQDQMKYLHKATVSTAPPPSPAPNVVAEGYVRLQLATAAVSRSNETIP
jgi:hypothetical protein